MAASDRDDAPTCDRPTIPAPRESGVRLQVARRAFTAAVVDVVVCDLARDPRSESFVGPKPVVSESDCPPALSNVIALALSSGPKRRVRRRA